MCDFKPGDEVVCVDGRDIPGSPIQQGQKYRVEAVIPSEGFFGGEWISDAEVVLEGVRNTVSVQHLGFASRRFRKVQRRSSETGMAILKSICDSPGQLEEDTKQDQVEDAARMVFGPWGDYTDDGTFGLH